MTAELRALTLWQPWASAVAHGLKRVETRPAWAMQLAKHVGERVAIHAAKHADWPTDPGSAAARLADRIPHPLWEQMRHQHGIEYPLAWTVQQPRGAVLATARIAAVMPMVPLDHQAQQEDEQYVLDSPNDGGLHARLSWGEYELIEDQRHWGDFTPGRVAVLLDDVRPLPHPVPARGYQRLWTLPPSTLAAVEWELAAAQVNEVLATPSTALADLKRQLEALS